MRLGRVGDDNFVDILLAESCYRIVRMSNALRQLPIRSDAQLASYVSKLARGAAIDAADDPIYGPTRRNAARRVVPTAAPIAVEWPEEAGDNWPGPETPRWSHFADRGDEWHCLVQWVVATAKKLATPEEKLAIGQVLNEKTDAEMARLVGCAKSSWQLRRAKLLPGLAPRIVAAADDRVDAVAEKYLGIDWILAASEAEPAVLLEERQRDAA